MRFHQGRALVIGVASYAEIPPLPAGVANDARDVAAILRSPEHCGYPHDNVIELIDGAASLDAVRDGLERLGSIARPDETVVVFFSGHGIRLNSSRGTVSGIVPYDCQMADVEGTILSEGEMSVLLRSIRAARLLVVLDACHAGDAASLKGLRGSELQWGFNDKSLGKLAEGTGRVVMASSRGTETSLILNGRPNSVFTGALLDGLKGGTQGRGDGLVRVFELFSHVAADVRQAVPGKQHPVLQASDLEDNFPIAMSSRDQKSVTLERNGTASQRDLYGIIPDLYPMGPMDQELWARAGGDPSLLKLGTHGRAAWFSALRLLEQGGGGRNISSKSLVRTALEEFPHHRELEALLL